MDTTKGNKLIAEFMGGILSNVPNLINLPQNKGESLIHCVKGSEELPNGTYSLHRCNELKYHFSWSWLMSTIDIIEKIDEGIYDVSILQDGTIISDWTEGKLIVAHTRSSHDFPDKISGTYGAVIKFIEWHNENSRK